jgi:hypothetical protein
MKRADRISIPAGARPGISRLRVRKKLLPDERRRETGPPLIVAGMHRSGTSFVASLLRAAGVDMGARLMPAAAGNARGHFENLDFVEFHMRWLRLTGHDASGWAAEHGLALPDDAASEAREILTSNARAAGWGWKDPRTTLFLEFWASIVPEANYLFVYREPSEVIDSLFRRGDEVIRLSPELAAQAYQSHNNMILRFARAHRSRCLIVNVAEAARDPKRLLAMISQRFEIDVDLHAASPFDSEQMKTIEPSSSRSTLLRYLLPELERLYARLEREAELPAAKGKSRQTTAKRAKEALLAEWCRDDTRQSALAARDAELRERREQLEQVRAFLADAEAGMRTRDSELSTRQARIDELHGQLVQTQAVLSARDTDLGARQEQLDQVRAFLADAEAGIQKRDVELSTRQARIEELLAQLTQTQSVLSARDRDLGARQEQLEQARAFLAEAESGNQKRDAELAARQTRIEELLEQVTRTQAVLATRDSDIAVREKQLAQARAFLAAAQTETQKRDAELAAGQSRIEELLAQVARVEGALSERDAELAAREARIEELRTVAEETGNALAAKRTELEGAFAQVQQLNAELENTRGILIRQTNDFINETRAESETLALLINTIQSGHFWKLKRGLARILNSLHIGAKKAGVRQ